LVYWAYGRHGIRLPRPSWKQIHAGFSVPQSQIRAGDLVFFKIVRGQSYHVGIYTGRGTFVHSPKAGSNVRESSLANSYWRRHYVTARRVALPARAQNP
jgi:cell wall-associated NlpC family hydrolase